MSLEDALFVVIPGWASEAEIAAIRDEVSGIDWSSITHTMFALRGYDAADPTYSADPAEMDLTWRELNPDKLDAVLTDTVAYQNFPVTRTVVDRVPGKKDRVRFMALAKKGRIVRHADNHDPALIRLHVPIITNPTVLFAVWDNSNRQVTRKFPEAALCYFNMRQPHAVQNGRDEPRIHLVIDVYSNPELLQLLSPYSHEPLARRPESRTRQALSHRERGRR